MNHRRVIIPLHQFPRMFPVVTSVLIIQAIVFFFFLISGHQHHPMQWIQFGAVVQWRVEEGEFWRLLFSLFLHVNLFQWLMVAFSIYLLAPQLEWLFGKSVFLLLFLVTGMIGNWGICWMDFQGIYTGATEAVFGLMGVYLYLLLRGIIHPLFGRAMILLIVLSLALGHAFLFAHILALLAGFVMAMVMIQIKQFTARNKSGF